MCGINGSLGKAESTVRSMNTAIEHRGPDDSGVFEAPGFTIGNNRLAVIDLSPLGHQPMISGNGRYSIAFNGEIYNFKEIRALLEKEGVTFKSHSDTEVILEGYAKWGKSITKMLRGMWALAIVDSNTNELFLSRDPFGIKPIYLYDDRNTLAFSSEIRGLLANENVKREINTETIKDVLVLGYPLAPRTILKNTKALLPGEEILIDLHTKKQTSEIQKLETSASTIPPTDEEFEKQLLDSVEHHLIADVPIGLFFSGGIDSTALAVALKILGKELNAYHVSVEGRDDTAYARKIAEHLKLPFKEIDFSKENIGELWKEMVKKTDQPFADASLIPTMLVSKHARKDVTVVLSGEGGDELFGGYLRHEKLSRIKASFANTRRLLPVEKIANLSSGKMWRSISRKFEQFRGNPLPFYLEETAIGGEIGEIHMKAQIFKQRIENREHPDGVLAIDRLVYLPDDLLLKIDTATMAYSLEGRVPFLDREVFKAVGNAPLSWKRENSISKAPLKRFLLKHLPQELVERPKTGFSIPLGSLFTAIGGERVNQAVAWYNSNLKGLLPAFDAVIGSDFEKKKGMILKNLGYSMFSLVTIHEWLEEHDLSL